MDKLNLPQWITFRKWLSSDLGLSFLKAEAKEVGELTTKLFGYYFILLGEPQFIVGLKNNPILNKLWLNPHVEKTQGLSSVACRQDKLAIISDDIELVYLAHALEFLQNPHETLREVYRILKPEGHVVISGFNPWSAWGLYKNSIHHFKKLPWEGRFISLLRLKDWLALLGFDVVETRYSFFRPPLSNENWLQKLSWLEKIGKWCCPFWSGCYIVLAKKRVMTLTPIKPAWKIRKEAVAQGLVEPVTRNR